MFDRDRSGQVDVREFMIGLSNFSGAGKEEKLKFAFTIFDEDGNGAITKQELVKILKANHMASTDKEVMRKAETIMAQADKDKDGVITFDEFVVVSKKVRAAAADRRPTRSSPARLLPPRSSPTSSSRHSRWARRCSGRSSGDRAGPEEPPAAAAVCSVNTHSCSAAEAASGVAARKRPYWGRNRAATSPVSLQPPAPHTAMLSRSRLAMRAAGAGAVRSAAVARRAVSEVPLPITTLTEDEQMMKDTGAYARRAPGGGPLARASRPLTSARWQ